MMEKNIPLVRESLAAVCGRYFMMMAKRPLQALCRYYSNVLERRLDLRQTWLLLHAQIAFFFAVLPVDGPLAVRALCCVWFALSVVSCRKALG